MSIATPSRLDHIQALRGLAAFMVLLFHMMPAETRASAQPILPDVFRWGAAGVDLFFVISGFIMVFITRESRLSANLSKPKATTKLAEIGDFLFARITRIYPLYWVVTLAVFAVWIVRPGMVFGNSGNSPELLSTIFLLPSEARPLLLVGWTLVYEMMFYILFALILILPRSMRVYGLLIWTALVTAGQFSDVKSLNAYTAHFFNPMVFEFLAGAFAGWLYLRVSVSSRIAWALITAGLIGLCLCSVSGVLYEDTGTRVAILIVPTVSLVLGAAWLDRAGVRAPRWTVTLGDWSYSLYLTHVLSIVLVSRLWVMADLRGLPSILILIIMVGFSILVAGLTYKLIERPAIRLARKGRSKLFA